MVYCACDMFANLAGVSRVPFTHVLIATRLRSDEKKNNYQFGFLHSVHCTLHIVLGPCSASHELNCWNPHACVAIFEGN